jgi:hypothetical protein
MSKLTQALGWPLRRALNPRVEWTVAAVDERLGSQGGQRPSVHDRVDQLEAVLRQLQHDQAVLAHEAAMERRAADEGFTTILEALRQVGSGLAAIEPDYQVPPLDRRGLNSITWPIAELINWSQGDHGYAAQAGLWFNPPVQVALDLGTVTPLTVNERIVEQGFVFAALAGVERPARILDVGGSQSTLALSLASLGHDVTVVDPGGYVLEHERLSVRACRLEELEGELGGFDAAVALSSLEHFGRPHYGLEASDERLDVAAARDLRGRVRPGGLLVLTVPFGEAAVDDFQRTYDLPGLHELLEGWEIAELSTAWQVSPTEWRRGDPERPEGDQGVALVVGRNPEG